jgi:hypothetical protein
MLLSDGEATIAFVPGESNHWHLRDEILEVTLTDELAQTFRNVVIPKAGRYVLPGLARCEIEVTKTEIKDQSGNISEMVG